MAEGGKEPEIGNVTNMDYIPPTGCFALDLSLEEDAIDLFITPNHLNTTPEDEENGGDIMDLLTAVSPNELDTGHTGTSGFAISTPKGNENGWKGTIMVVNETIGDETLREFTDNVSITSDEDDLVSLATRVNKKEIVNQMKGRSPDKPTEKDIPSEDSCKDAETENTETRKTKTGKGRFVRASEKDVEELQFESKAKRTHSSTKWAIKLLKGRFVWQICIYFSQIIMFLCPITFIIYRKTTVLKIPRFVCYIRVLAYLTLYGEQNGGLTDRFANTRIVDKLICCVGQVNVG